MAEHTEWNSSDQESQENKSAYHELLENIRLNMNPDSNTVLLVDDELSIRKRVARDITGVDKNIVVYEAGNGKEALERLAEIRQKYKRDPVFMVLDLNMPVMTGWEVIEQLREDYVKAGKTSGIPIIVLSSTSGDKGSVPFFRKTVHGGKMNYTPLVTIAKEACVTAAKYDAKGEKGLLAWMKHFMRTEG